MSDMNNTHVTHCQAGKICLNAHPSVSYGRARRRYKAVATAKTERNAKLFIAILAPEGLLEEAEDSLTPTLGPLDRKSRAFPFSFTDYYRAEMGSNLYRRFVAVEDLIAQDVLVEIKRRTNRIERERFGLSGEKILRRRVNLDPGYVTPAKIVLASTKDYAHRIYLGQGIFGDLQLKYEQGAYQPLPWTYPDYRTHEALTFFAELRRLLLQEK